MLVSPVSLSTSDLNITMCKSYLCCCMLKCLHTVLMHAAVVYSANLDRNADLSSLANLPHLTSLKLIFSIKIPHLTQVRWWQLQHTHTHTHTHAHTACLPACLPVCLSSCPAGCDHPAEVFGPVCGDRGHLRQACAAAQPAVLSHPAHTLGTPGVKVHR